MLELRRFVPTALVAIGILASSWSFDVAASASSSWSASLSDSVAALPVGTELRSGYSRDLFTHWIDADGDCQNARAEVLIGESLAPVTFTTSTGCTVLTGQWYSYFDGVTGTAASDFDIDHMVPLAEAWDSGAHSWTSEERRAFANDLGDPRTLVAVTDDSNVAKSDSDPAQWLPQLDRCRYVGEWVAVKIRWGLTVDTSEKSALTQWASQCPVATVTVAIARGSGPPTSTPLVLSGRSRTQGTTKYADLSWTGSATRVDLWRGSTRLLTGTTVRSHTDRVSKSVRSATYSVCPAGVARSSPTCSSLTLTW